MEGNEQCLVHYGVLGMKWGVRRNRKNARYAQAYSMSTAVNAYNGNKDKARKAYKKAVHYSAKSQKRVNKLLNKYGDKLYSEIEKLPTTENMPWLGASPEFMSSYYYNVLKNSKK